MTQSVEPSRRLDARQLPSVALLVILQATISAASLVVEIVAGRMLAPYVGMSLYTWTSVIAVVLAGFSAGHWVGGRIAERQAHAALLATGWSMAAAALTTAAAVLLLRWSAGPVMAAFPAPVASITALAMIVFFLPSFFAGIPAPVLARISVESQPHRSGRALGAMFAASAVGAIAGTLLAGFVFISWLGSIGTLATVTAAYVLVTLIILAEARRGAPIRPAAVGAVMASALGLAGWSLAAENPCTRESHYFCIRVVDISADPANPVKLMALDHLVHGISSRGQPDVMFTPHASMIDNLARTRMGERPFSAYFIGGGTYSIPRSWGPKEAIAVTVAEIDPAVTDIAVNEFWFDPASARVFDEDARRALLVRPDRYDVVIGDAFTDIAVPPHLVTREFFALVAERLNPGGVYLMNVVDHAGRLDALASIVRTLRDIFPVVEIWTEQGEPAPDERLVFVVLAGHRATTAGTLAGLAPDPHISARLPEEWVDRLLAERGALVLTDDYAPIDRLMGRMD